MKMIVVVALALVALAAAAPPVGEPVSILRSSNEPTADGGYEFGFESSDGIAKQETGQLKEAVDEDNKPRSVVVVRGSYSYTDPETGNPISVTYEADENGFRAFGDHIPKPARR